MAQTYYTSHIDGECATLGNGTVPARCHGEACAACHGTSVCVGVDCFRNSHAVAGALAACGALCLLVLTLRKRPLYVRIWYASALASTSTVSMIVRCLVPGFKLCMVLTNNRGYENEVNASAQQPVSKSSSNSSMQIARHGSGSIRV